jgi:hypothetical protein
MDQEREKTLEAFGVMVNIVETEDGVRVEITKEESVKLHLTAPPEPPRFPFSQCGAMC